MIGAARYEILALNRDRRAFWSVLCLAMFIVLAFAGSFMEISRMDAVKQSVAAAERARWLGQGEKDPHSAAHYSVYAFKPSPALAALDTGSTAFLGQSVWLEAHHQNDMLYRPRQDASLLERSGAVSPVVLITIFGPLIIFLLAYTAISHARDQGSFRLALGTASGPLRLAAAKALAIWAVALALFVIPVSILAALTSIGGDPVGAGTRLVLWLLVMSAYLGIASLAGVVTTLSARNPRVALAGLMGAWIVFVLILPKFSSATADTLRPLPSSQAVRQEMLDQAPAYWSAEEGKRQKAALLARYGAKDLSEIPNPRMAELDMVERHSHQVFDRVLGRFYGQVKAQDRLFSWAGIFSPAIAATVLSSSVTGTDFSHHFDFINTAELYRRDLVNRMNADGMAHRAHGAERHVNDQRLWSQIPEFTYVEPALSSAGQTAVPALLALLAWVVVGGLCFVGASRRLKP